MECVEVDGSEGEGGGQILRTAVAFSAIMKTPVKVTNVRAGRPEPGLRTQHASALRVLADVFGGTVSGAEVGSSEVTFVPGAPELGVYRTDMGTAASITLVLQAVVPAVALSGARLSLSLVGGTDVPWSPTFDYFLNVVGGAFGALGVRFRAEAERRGFYPRGGGSAVVAVEPCQSLRAVELTLQPPVRSASILSICGSLPKHVAERQLEGARKKLMAEGFAVGATSVSAEETLSPGSSVLVFFAEGGAYLGADSLGARGRRAEEVGEDAAERFVESARSGACLDTNLADMVVPLLSLAGGDSRVRVQGVSEHLRSGMRIASMFTSAKFSVEPEGTNSVVAISPLARTGRPQHNV